MLLALKLGWRNLWRHKGKCLVIGVILFLGALLMTVGNGIISGMEDGLAENIVDLFTGDLVLVSDEQEKDNVLFDMMSGKPLKVIKNYTEAEGVLNETEYIDQYLPATAGFVFVLNTGGDMGQMMLLGVDFERYREMFPDSIKLLEGRYLKTGERGLLVSDTAREQAYDFMGFWTLPEGEELDESQLTEDARENIENLEIKRDIVFMGASTSNSTMDVRVPVKGVIKYKALSRIWGSYCIIDIESFREAHNYVTGADSTVELSEEEQELFNNDELDSYFNSSDLVTTDVISEEGFSIEEIQTETQKAVENYDVDKGSYNLAFVKLKEGISQKAALNKLNSLFKEKGLSIRAVSWKNAIGTFGSMAVMIKSSLNIFIMFIFFVAVIVIMNTLSMTALERISELAMMRAIGARKGFVRKMFIAETGVLSFFFGGLGIISGIGLIFLLNYLNITTDNELLQMIYGGYKLNPLFTFPDLLLGITELSIVTFLAVLYPLRVVGKIVPLDAVVRE